jgi:tetratricopeptide (TPR) repeat protein
MFAVEYNLGGLNPLLGHFVNILLYVFTVCSLLYILQSFCKGILTKSERWFFAGICTLLFAVHPIHTEVVANIKSRDEILVFFGGLWSIYFATRFLEVGRIKYGFFSGLTLLIALFSKENAIAFLAVIPMTLYFFKQKDLWQIVKATLPAMLATLIYLGVRYLVVGLDLGGEQPLELMNNPFLRLEDGKYIYMTASEKYPLIIFGLIKYLQLLFFPHTLTHDYYPKFFADLNWTDPAVLLSMLLLVSLGILTVLFARRQKIVSYAILFFFATIFLTSNLLFPVGTHLSERFLFTPSLAWALLVTSFLYWARAKIGFYGTLVAATSLTVIFAFKTIDRNRAWKSNYILFTTDVKTSYRSAKMQNAVGGVMVVEAQTMADTALRTRELEAAIGHLEKAIVIHPGYKNAYLLLGNAHYYLKQYAKAITYFNYALQLDPSYEEAINNRSFAYRDIGRYYGEVQGDLPKALEYLEKAHQKLQDDYETVRLLGIAYGNSGQPKESIAYFKQALSLKPNDGWTHYNLGLAYLAIQDSVSANHYISKAKTLNPDIGK